MWLLLSLLSSPRLSTAASCAGVVPPGLVFCSQLPVGAVLSVTDGATPSAIDSRARQFAALLSGSTTCTAPYGALNCPNASLSSSDSCLVALQQFACRWTLAPKRDWTTGLNCETATLATPSVAECQSVFSTCGYTSVVVETGGAPLSQASLCNANGPLDFIPPVVSGCANLRVPKASNSLVDYKTASAVDAQSGIASTTYLPNKDPPLFSVGATPISFTAIDLANNKNGCNYEVIIGVCLTASDCQNQATCVANVCVCGNSQFGDYCEKNKTFCPGDSACSGKGDCNFTNGQCQCISGWGGDECNSVPCPEFRGKPCNGVGICHPVGVCQCDVGWLGATCQIKIEEQGMTSGELAGAVIGGMLFSFIFLICLGAYVFKDDIM
eukprot:gb/GEZN01010018.1/.p1 GENE.gb/GEZN01010018.1/~~gb/GEZN01010018.1/.p1  ORF type:complete len:383 (-),score=43.73 gb/GEZN01010018.1/:82-1230(-)